MLPLPWPSSHVSWTCTGAAQAQRESNSCSARLTISDLLTGDKHVAKVLTVCVTSLHKQKQSQDNLSLQLGCLDAIWVSPAEDFDTGGFTHGLSLDSNRTQKQSSFL